MYHPAFLFDAMTAAGVFLTVMGALLSGMFIFTLIKILYFFVNAGLVIRLFFVLRGEGISKALRWGVCGIVVACSLAYPVSRYVDGNGWGVRALTFIGTFWLSLVLHGLLAWLALGVFRLLNWHWRWFAFAPARAAHWRHLACAGIAGAALLVSTLGWINAFYPTVRVVKLTTPAGIAPLRIVALSDTHLGRLASPEYFGKIVDLIEPLAPDIVLFAGDVIEYDYDPSEVEPTAAVLRRLKPRLGIWGVFGNHEYIGGREALNKQLLDRIGIRILIDQWAEIAAAPGQKLLLIGRDDLSSERAMDRKRKTLGELLAEAPPGDHLKILLDHQPFNLEEAEAAGIFLQISGHTHNGQLFPFNGVVALIYENAYGYLRRGQTHYWVSSGAGTWGPSVRTTGRPEILLIDIAAEK
ncbi:MAG: metallophosphoesterase [Azoarcus sp.]|jgi:predicted MPP superfamily phosphohydrolase|nr:metallophosphoesterase [Azoarcus sp.]